MSKDKYSIKEVYRSYFDSHQKAAWSTFLWNRASPPKGKFILWEILLNKLKTKDKLFQMKYLQEDCCSLCNTAFETVAHIFFTCPFSARCLTKLSRWLTLPSLHMDINQVANFKRCTDCFHTKIIISSLCSLCYHI